MIHTSYTSQLMPGLSALVFLLVPMVSWAVPILVPTDLNPGDTYHLVFVSSTFRDATSTAIADYNAHVQAAADNATISIGVGSSIGDIIWKAIGTTDSVNAIDNINVSGPVYRIDNVRVADDETDLFDGSIQASISITENGVFQLGPIFTGSLSDGTDDNGLLELGDATGSNSYVGSSTATTGGGWITAGFFNQSFPFAFAFYGISEPLVVAAPVIPEPGTLTLFGTGLLGLMGWAARRKRRCNSHLLTE